LVIGTAVFGESMFTLHSGASKVAFATAAPILFNLGVTIIDCQMRTGHLERFGIVELNREEFESRLAEATARATIPPLPGVLR
ncbi:MAG: hypothetical protein VW258_07875, partial [Thalassolituus sp.]